MPVLTYASPLNSDTEWSLMGLGDLANCILRRTSIEETVEFLCRDVKVREKIEKPAQRLSLIREGDTLRQ
jgi:hypothetical protein